MSVAKNALELIGNTPLVCLSRLGGGYGAEIYGKCEFMNPLGSVKDRAALAMIEAAERDGLIDSETVIIEPTSGNTGVALAFACSVKGYKLIIAMPESMSLERRQLLKAFGVQLELTPAHLQMPGAIEKAKEIAAGIENSFIPHQFNNEANPLYHEKTTAEEIWRDMDSDIDVFVAGVGTGGTITGVGRSLKSKNADIEIVAVEPASSPVISGGEAGPHMIQGIGAGFIPNNLDRSVVDSIIQVKNEDAVNMAKLLIQKEGLLCGISAGANVFAALELAKKESYKGKKIVTVLCDTGERYLSTPMFKFES